MLSQDGAVLVALHVQPVGALTVKLPVAAPAATFAVVGFTWYVQVVPEPCSYAPMSIVPTAGLGVADVAAACSGGTASGGHNGLGNAVTLGVDGAEGLPMLISGLVALSR